MLLDADRRTVAQEINEGNCSASQPEIIVFDLCGPAGGERDFYTRAEHIPRAGLLRSEVIGSRGRTDHVVFFTRPTKTGRSIEKHIAICLAQAACHAPNRIDSGVAGEARSTAA
jgi:hypothetical protein